MRRAGRVFILVLLLALAGCAGIAQRDDASRTGVLLAEYRRLAALPAEEQARAHQEALADFERQPDDWQRLRLALVLALPRAPWRDDARLLQLLDGFADASPDGVSPSRDLAFLLMKTLEERQPPPREETRRAEERLQRLLAERQRQLREAQRKVEELEQKVDALRSIDRDALHRQNKR